jgi:high-affinity iron transporter
MLREGFEVSLIVGIVLAFLDRTNRRDGFAAVWAGAIIALAISAAIGATLFLVGGELEGSAEKIWEGAAMLTAATLLTWMIFWMRRQARTIKSELEGKIQNALAGGSSFALAAVAFVGVLREGVETSFLLFGAIEGSKTAMSALSGLVGLTIAIALGYAFYKGSSRLDLRRFFTITSALLLLFGGWLLANGLHELAEGGVIPESQGMLMGAFAALAGPTLWFYFRGAPKLKPKPAPTA